MVNLYFLHHGKCGYFWGLWSNKLFVEIREVFIQIGMSRWEISLVEGLDGQGNGVWNVNLKFAIG